MNNFIMSKSLNIFKKLILVHILFLFLMTLFRVAFVLYYSPLDSFHGFYFELFKAFLLGFRLDLTVIGYIQVLPTIILIILYYLKNEKFLEFSKKFFVFYLFITYSIVSFFLCADFGFFDDDTKALLVTFWQNYNVVLILFIFFIYIISLFYVINKIFKAQEKEIVFFNFFRFSVLVFLIFFLLNFLAIRGTLGMYPLGKMIPNVSTNDFIYKISQN